MGRAGQASVHGVAPSGQVTRSSAAIAATVSAKSASFGERSAMGRPAPRRSPASPFFQYRANVSRRIINGAAGGGGVEDIHGRRNLLDTTGWRRAGGHHAAAARR